MDTMIFHLMQVRQLQFLPNQVHQPYKFANYELIEPVCSSSFNEFVVQWIRSCVVVLNLTLPKLT